MKTPTWETLDWAALDRLRATFLAAQPGAGSYWTSVSDVANYDFTFAQRIGWKWDAVLRELKLRGWSPPAGAILDWGCGSGIASRRLIESFPPAPGTTLHLSDRSAVAVQFAAQSARANFPQLEVVDAGARPEGLGTLVISHVLNELDEAGGRALRSVIDRADAILWVEPGTYADSRSLIQMREALRGDFRAIAPCTHQHACGLLAAGNERHWCHHFAEPPAGIMADSHWVRFAQRAGVDLRSLPYSFLVLERHGTAAPANSSEAGDWSRLIGEPRIYKGYARLLCCQADGVRELELQKRDAPELYKAMKSGQSPQLINGERNERRFVSVGRVI